MPTPVPPACPAGARVKRLQEPPGLGEQVVVIWAPEATLAPGQRFNNAQVGRLRGRVSQLQAQRASTAMRVAWLAHATVGSAASGCWGTCGEWQRAPQQYGPAMVNWPVQAGCRTAAATAAPCHGQPPLAFFASPL